MAQFCSNCGSALSATANFCPACGAHVHHSEPAPPPLPISGTPAQVPSAHQTCSWCGAVIEGVQASCPRCGGILQAPVVTGASGWGKLPGRKDMAKLQFGNSFCQIEGNYVPVADFNLAANDFVYFTHHVLLWKDPQVNITAMSLRGGWTRLLSGMPLVMTQAHGPGHIAFSRDAPGEMVALPIQPGSAVDVREHLFVAATGSVTYDWFSTGIWFSTRGSEGNEMHYPVGILMDRFFAPQAPGLLLLHAAGNVFVRELAPGQSILIKPTALLFKDPTVQMQLHFERPRASFTSWGSWGNRYMWLRMSGPGRVAVHSVFEPIEGESRGLVNFSYATEQQW